MTSPIQFRMKIAGILLAALAGILLGLDGDAFAQEMTSPSFKVKQQETSAGHSHVDNGVYTSDSASFKTIHQIGDSGNTVGHSATSTTYKLGEGYTFTLNNPPAVPKDQNLASDLVRFPADATFVLSDTPSFAWANPGDYNEPDGMHFQIQVEDDSNSIVLDGVSSVDLGVLDWDFKEELTTMTWTDTYDSAQVEGYDNEVDGDIDGDLDTADAIRVRPVAAMANGIYTWKMRGLDDFEFGQWSSEFNVQVNPPAPTLQTPADGTLTSDDTPTFDWDDNTAPWNFQYQIQIATDVNFATIVQDQTIAVSTFTAASLPDDKYWWRVRSFDGGSNPTPWSDKWTIVIDTTGPTGTISINSGDAYTGSATVTLTLTAADVNPNDPSEEVAGIDTMEFSNSTDFSAATPEAFNTTRANWVLENASDGAKSVFIRLTDGAGNQSVVDATGGHFSHDEIVFDTTSPTGTIAINNGDAETNSTSATIDLTSVSDALSGMDEVRFSNDGVAFTPFEDFTALGGSKSWTLANGDGTKTVTVEFSDNAGNTVQLSDTITLDTAGPPTPTLLSPADAFSIFDPTPDLDWTDVVDATTAVDRYEVEVDDDAGFGSIDFNAAPTASTQTISPALANGTWYWRVRAVDTAGNNGSYSNTFSFEITNNVAEVVLTPPTVTADAGTVVTFTAELRDTNGTRVNANSVNDASFAVTAGSGSLGAKTLVNGTIQVEYTTFADPENAEITVIENRSGSSFSDISTIVSQGTLAIFEGSANPSSNNQLAGSQNVAALQFILQTGTGEDINIIASRLDVAGTGIDDTDITDVTLVEDTDQSGTFELGVDRVIATGGLFDADDGTVSFTGLSEQLADDSTFTWLYLVSFSAAAAPASDYTFTINPTNHISALGVDSSSSVEATGISFSGGPISIVSQGGTGSMTISAGSNNSCDKNELTDALAVEMVQIAFSASSVEDILVSQFRVDATGTANDTTDITIVALFEDVNNNGIFDAGLDRLLGSQNYSVDDGAITFSGLAEVVSAGSTNRYLVIYDYSGTASLDETFTVTVDPAGVVATGNDSNDAITVQGAQVSGGTVTITDTGGSTLGGSLTLYRGENNPSNQSEPNNVQNIVIQQLLLAASSVENIRLDSIIFTGSGSGDDFTDISAVNLAVDVDRDGQYDPNTDRQIGPEDQVFSADNGTVGFNGLSEVISAGSALHLILVYDMTGTAAETETFSSSIAFDAEVEVTGLTTATDIVPCGAPKNGGTLIIADPSTDAGSLRVKVGGNSPSDTNQTNDAQNVEMLQFELRTSSLEAISLQALTFTAAGTGHDVNDLSSVTLARDLNNNGILDSGDDVLDASQLFNTDNGTVTFSGLTETLVAGTTQNWLLAYTFDGTGSLGSTFQLQLQGASDVTATGATSGQPISAFGLPIEGGIVTFVASGTPGNLTVNEGPAMPPAATVPAGSAVVGVFQMQLTASSVENINVTGADFTGTGTGDDSVDITSVTIFEDTDNDGVVTVGIDRVIASGGTFDADNGTVSFAALNEIIDRDETVSWLVAYDISSGTADNSTFQLTQTPSTGITAAGVSSAANITANGTVFTGNEFSVGGIGSGAKGTLASTNGAFNTEDNDRQAFEQNVPMLHFNLRAGVLEDIVMQSIILSMNGTGNDIQDISEVTLVEDATLNGIFDEELDRIIGTLKNPFKADNGTATFTGLTERINADSTTTYLVVIDFSGKGAVGGTFELTLNPGAQITALGVDSGKVITASGNAVTGGQVTLVPIDGSSGAGGGCFVDAAEMPTRGMEWLLILAGLLLAGAVTRKRRIRT